MIYFFDKGLHLQKIVTRKNVNSVMHEDELNGLILSDIELDLSYTQKFLVLGIDYVGYYYKDEFHLHRIKRVEHIHEEEKVIIASRHIFFDDMLGYNIIKDFRPQNRDAKYVLDNTIGSHTRWNIVSTDTFKILSGSYYYQLPMEVLNKVVEAYQIEYKPKILFDGQTINGFQLHIAEQIDKNPPIRIPFGDRVLNLKHEMDYSEISTAVIGRGKGEEAGEGYGRRLEFTDSSFSRNGVVSPVGQNYMEDPAITEMYGYDDGQPKFEVVEFSDIEIISNLEEATYDHYLEVSRPKMLFEASVSDIGDVAIGDTVAIVRPKYNVAYKARIHKLTVDLLYPEDAQVELGDYEHFKESKVERKRRQNDNQWKRQTSSVIEQMKRDWNADYEGVKEDINTAYEQAVIDANAEVAAAEERMQADIDAQRQQMEQEITQARDEAIEQAEADAKAKADAVQGNLESFEQTHQQLYDEVTGDIMDIDTFLGDKTISLSKQFEDMETGINEDISVESGRIDAIVTNFDGNGKSLAEFVLDVEGIETTVARHNDDMVEGFSEVDQRFDSITNTVANIKLNTRNMLMGTTFEDPSLITLYNDAYIRIGGDEDYAGHIRMGPSDGFNTTSFKFDNLVKFEANTDYYLVLEHRTLAVKELDYLQMEREDGSWTPVLNADTGDEGFVGLDFGTLDWNKNTIRINFPETVSGRLRIGTRFNQGNTNRGWIDVFQPYLTNTMNREWVPHPRDGQNMDEIVDRVSQVEQLAESVRIDVQEVTNSALTQSDITVESDRITIGSTSISSSTLASIISVSPSAIDIITDELNLTGNLNVKGQIEAISLDAIDANFARVQTAILKSNVITSDMVGANVIQAEHIFVQNAMIEDIVNTNLFTNTVNAMSINAVYADLRSVNSEIMTSNIIKSNWLNVDTALFNRFTASTAFIESLTAKTVFARDVQAITMDAVQANITTVMNSMGEVEGGLYITGPDGREFINNSMLKASFDVQIRPNYAGNNVEFTGLNYVTQNSMWQTFEHFYTDHKGSQLLVSWAVGMQSGVSSSEYIEFRTRGFGSNNPIGTWPGRLLVRPGETSYHNQVINLGVPDYNGIQGYLEFRRDPAGANSSNRVTARVLRVSLIN